jgi:thioredoxin 1
MRFWSSSKKESKNKKTSKIEWPNHIVTLDEKSFEEFIRKHSLAIIDFWAPWCAPCKTMSPRLRRLSLLYRNKAAFGKINIQKYQKISKKYNISSIPTLIFFQYGKVIRSSFGVKSVGKIKTMIDNELEKL